MSPALQKLRKDLDHAKARHSKPADAEHLSGHGAWVGFDIIEMLFAALVAQDAEIRKLKSQASLGEPSVDASASSDSKPVAATGPVDSYVAHSDPPEHSPIYSPKHPKPPAVP
jgi:hypothetical protein